MAFIDTDFVNNVQRIRPFVGVALVASIALGVFMVLNNAMQDFTQAFHTEAPLEVQGNIKLISSEPLVYKNSVSFHATAYGVGADATVYISAVCFQGETLVYQRSAQPGVSFYLVDQYERDLVWNGEAASCSASLMYRVARGSNVDVYVLDSVAFDVSGQ